MKKIYGKKDKIETARLQNGMNSVEFAKKCGLTGPGIRAIENRKAAVKPSTAKAIADALNVPFEELFDIVDGDGE